MEYLRCNVFYPLIRHLWWIFCSVHHFFVDNLKKQCYNLHEAKAFLIYIIFVRNQLCPLVTFFWLQLWESNPLFSAYETDEISVSLKLQYKRGKGFFLIPYKNATGYILQQSFKNVNHFNMSSKKFRISYL